MDMWCLILKLTVIIFMLIKYITPVTLGLSSVTIDAILQAGIYKDLE